MTTEDRVLDALDDCPKGWISGLDGTPSRSFTGPLATIQMLAARLELSDSAVRRAVHRLHRKGLVVIIDAMDPESRKRRLHISGVQG